MAADASIYGQIRPFTMEDPLTHTARALSIRNAQLQNQEAERRFTLEDDISGALTRSGGDLGMASRDLAARGRGTAALSLREKAATVDKTQVETHLKILEAASSDGIALDAAYRQALQANGGDQAKAIAAIQPTYNEIRSRWAPKGVNLPEQFDPVKNLAGVGQAKEQAQYLKTLVPHYGAPVTATDASGKPVLVQPSSTGGAPRTVEGVTPRDNPTELARLMAERDALPQGDPRRAQYDRTIKAYKAGRGTDVTVNTGEMTPGKTAGNKIDEDMLGVTRNLMQLDTIAGQFKPEFQRFQDKAGFMALKAKDSTVGLTNKEKQDLTEYSTYRRNAFNTLNEYIKSITGAAMSEAEANRIRKSMPDPGDGLFSGDSPTEFKAKLDDAMAQTKKSVARLAYLKRNGMSLEDGLGKGITLEGMPALMNERGQKIEAELKAAQPGASKDAMQKAVRRQLAVEFGLSSD